MQSLQRLATFQPRASPLSLDSPLAAPLSPDSLALEPTALREEAANAFLEGSKLFSGMLDSVREFEGFYQTALPSMAGLIDDTRDQLRVVLEEERVAAVVLLVVATSLALGGGTLRGVATKSLPESSSSLFRTQLTEAEAAAFDAGGATMPIRRSLGLRRRSSSTGSSTSGSASASSTGSSNTSAPANAVSPGLWLELILCVLLDAAGDASLFYPLNGGDESLFYPLNELTDVGFAFAYAFAIELFFDWPALALLAFWEELLPFVDIVPTATFGWFLVVVLGARPDRRAETGRGGKGLFRVTLDPEVDFAPGSRPPVSDRRSYQPAEPWLRKGTRPWEQ